MANTHSLRVSASTATTGGQGITAPDRAAYDILTSNEFTFECWVKVNSLLSGTPGLWERWANPGSNKNLLIRIESDGTVSAYPGTGSTTLSAGLAQSTTAIDDSSWHHVAVTWNGSVLKMYIDGTLEDTGGSVTPGAASDDAGIAGAPINGGSGQNFDGWIDDIRVWDVERSQSEIDTNKSVELVGTETNLIDYWKLDNDYTNEVSGASSLTANNSPTFATDPAFSGGAVTVTPTVLALTSSVQAPTITGNISVSPTATVLALTASPQAPASAGGAAGVSTHPTIAAKLDAYWELEEASGDRVDSHGSFDLTANGSPGNASAGKIGDAVALATASDQWLSHADNAIFDIVASANDASFACWIKTTTTTSAPAIAGKWGPTQRNWLFRVETDGTLGIYAGNGGGTTGVSVKSTGTVDDGNWHHVGFTFDSSTNVWRIYIDGSLDGTSATAAPAASTAGFAVGAAEAAGTTGSSDTFTGDIDEALWCQDLLSASEFSDLYNGGDGIGYSTGGSGGTDVTPTATVLDATVTLNAPTVITDGQTIISATVLALTTDTPQPQNETGVGVTFTDLNATVTLNAPTITADQSVTVTPTVLDLTTDLRPPSLINDNNAVLSVSVLNLTAGLQAPTIVSFADITVTPTVLALTPSVQAPTVDLQFNGLHEATVLALTAALQTPPGAGGVWSPIPRAGDEWAAVEASE